MCTQHVRWTEDDPTWPIQEGVQEGDTWVGSGAQTVQTAWSVGAPTVETTSFGDDADKLLEVASGTAMADAGGSPVPRTVVKVPVAAGAGVQAIKTASSKEVMGTPYMFRMTYVSDDVPRASSLGIPDLVREMSTRMLECFHDVKEAEHRGVDAVVDGLPKLCVSLF